MNSKLHDAVRAFGAALTTKTPAGKPAQPHIPTFDTGTVTAVQPANGTCDVQFPGDPSGTPAAVTIGAMPCVNGVPPDGAKVVTMQLAHQRIVLGPLKVANSNLLAYAKASAASGGACSGRYGDGTGGGVSSLGVSNVSQVTNLGVSNVPVIAGHLLRVRFRFWAGGPFNSGVDWYFNSVIAENFGPWNIKGEMRNGPAGANSPAPFGEDLYVVPNGVTSISARIDIVLSSSTGTLYRYHTTNEACHSLYTLEDLGPA